VSIQPQVEVEAAIGSRVTAIAANADNDAGDNTDVLISLNETPPHSTKITSAFLRVEKLGKGWKVAAISVDKQSGNWFLFENEHCNPDLHAYLIANKKLRGLKVKVYRNFQIDSLFLPVYLNAEWTKFEFSGKMLKQDVEKSVIDKGIIL
jgi:hypothetical protein